MKYTNTTKIPLAVAVFLATDDYDYEPNTVSATSLLKTVRQFILNKCIQKEDREIDVASLVSSRMGSAIHTAIEKAWLNPTRALKLLGYPERVWSKVVINPTEVKDGDIPIYMEQRAYKDVLGMRVSGKFDFVAEGKVQDFKSTSVYSYLNQSNREKYILQGSIYRWLNQDKVTQDVMDIHYFFTDWNKKDSLSNTDYPKNRVLTQTFKLLSIQETENWVINKIKQFKTYDAYPESALPQCTDEELWRKETVFKYYKDPNKTSRSTKNFKTLSDAMAMYISDGSKGVVHEVKGQVAACKYCPGFDLCTQKDKLIESGDLVL